MNRLSGDTRLPVNTRGSFPVPYFGLANANDMHSAREPFAIGAGVA